jgi:3-methyladenine DNA glycosylase/8-oxoguanine DNA glycosylase
MAGVELELKVNEPFGFRETVFAHGWVTLAPFQWDAQEEQLRRIERLESGRAVRLRIWDGGAADDAHLVRVSTVGANVSEKVREELASRVRWMLRMDEDLGEFYDLCSEHEPLRFVVERGAGRLLRSPTVFEDAVKVLCTTNTNWSQTMAVVMRLCEKLGEPLAPDEGLFAFPSPEQIARQTDDFLREEIRLGYRATNVRRLGEAVASGELDLETLKDESMGGDQLRHLLLRLDGFGPYAVAQMMSLLGRYDYIGVDSDMRNFVSRAYFNDGRVTDAQILQVYHRWGKWKYLVYWAESYGSMFSTADTT